MVFESFSYPEEWDLVNFRIKNELNTPYQIRSYLNPFMATHDLLVSLAQLYAHKRSVAWVSGVSPLLENSQPYFIRESYQVQNIKMTDLLLAADQGQSLIEGLNKDTLFLVFFKNHALTGESYSHEKIEEWAISKKIMFILISHEFNSELKFSPNSFSVQVLSKDLTVAFLPERTKLTSSIGGFQNLVWNSQWSGLLSQKVNTFEATISDWESSLYFPKWSYRGQRSWDRSLIVFENLHADMVVAKLKEKGFPNIRSFADCVSHSPKSIRSWMTGEISDDQLRSLVEFRFFSEKDLPSKIIIDDLVHSLRAESEWTY